MFILIDCRLRPYSMSFRVFGAFYFAWKERLFSFFSEKIPLRSIKKTFALYGKEERIADGLHTLLTKNYDNFLIICLIIGVGVWYNGSST